jgi:hypothetical protein
MGVALTHDLTVVIGRHELAIRPLAGVAGLRRVQVALSPGPHAPAVDARPARAARCRVHPPPPPRRFPTTTTHRMSQTVLLPGEHIGQDAPDHLLTDGPQLETVRVAA